MPDEDSESLFKIWLAEHGGAVLKVARAYAYASEDRQDLVQEILLQLWRSIPQFNGRSSASTWVYRVALNTALSWRRKERRRQEQRCVNVDVADLSADGADGVEHAADREALEQLYAAIRQLPQTDAALVLLYLDDMSYRQMAEVLGITESNVGVKLNRARKALAGLLKEESHGS